MRHPSEKRSVVRALRTALALVFALAVLNAAAGAQYLFTDQQSGWTLKPKQLEVGGAFGSVSFNAGGESDHAWNIYGLNLGYGLFKNVELRVRYGYLDPGHEGSGASAFSFGPKIGLWKNMVAIIVPFEFLTGQYVETSQTWNIQPGLVASIPVGKKFEITPSVKALIPLSNEEGNETLMAVNLGFGFFATAEKNLIIRPEIGFLFKPGDSGNYLQFGIGISYCTKPKA
jgi:hypothetical protein